MKKLVHSSKPFRVGILIAGVVGLSMAAMAWYQLRREQSIDMEDIDRRAHMLAHQIAEPAAAALAQSDAEAAAKLSGRLEGYRRLIGFAVYRADGNPLAMGKAVHEFADILKPAVARSLRDAAETTDTDRAHGTLVHLLARPLSSGGAAPAGVLVAVHDISHLEERTTSRLVWYAFGILIVVLVLTTFAVVATWIEYDRPLVNLADWMRRLRIEDSSEAPPAGLPTALLATESDRLAASFRAARASGAAQSRAVAREQNVWNRDRLRAQAIDCLNGAPLVVVSNREPYMHVLRDGKPQMIVPAGGLVTALDPVLQACGGLWVAHGSGDADRETADPFGRLTVPPHDSRYTLRRVWLTRDEEQGYYYGLANEGIWPLCHLAHERPEFRASDWKHYKQCNRRFAEIILDEVGSAPATVLVQDYQLALVPQLLKSSRPDLRVGIFWHIPWPNPEAFRICPWRAEIVQGLLGADVVGFHLQQYCNNFLDTVDRVIEARLDWDHFAVELRGHLSLVRPYPISVESWAERGVTTGDLLARRIAHLKEQHHLDGVELIVGVERIDYTKGLIERFRAIGRLLEKYPHLRGTFAFVQLGAPSRTHIPRYRDLITHLETLADEINWRFATDEWKPIRFLVAHHDAAAVHAWLSMAGVCIVSSLHDGMNLVAKEYVAAKDDGQGVLVLSEFAGAARELADAVIINPYDTEQFVEAVRFALEMDPEERKDRMDRMRRQVEEHNIYRWAGNFLTDLAAARTMQPARTELRHDGPEGLAADHKRAVQNQHAT
jgi:trehalose 6-phosphate synthase